MRGVGALENSLWGFDGEALRIWLDALTITSQAETTLHVDSVVENVRLPLEFYPLCRLVDRIFDIADYASAVLMDKGIIIGAEQEVLVRSSLSLLVPFEVEVLVGWEAVVFSVPVSASGPIIGGGSGRTVCVSLVIRVRCCALALNARNGLLL